MSAPPREKSGEGRGVEREGGRERETDRQTDGRTDGQTDREEQRQRDRGRDRQTEVQFPILSYSSGSSFYPVHLASSTASVIVKVMISFPASLFCSRLSYFPFLCSIQYIFSKREGGVNKHSKLSATLPENVLTVGLSLTS